jgi:hypothetical protein
VIHVERECVVIPEFKDLGVALPELVVIILQRPFARGAQR